MNLNKSFLVLISLVLLSISVQASEKPNIIGIYTELPGQKFKFDGQTVEVTEFFSFYCHTCYAFEDSIPIIKGKFTKVIKWKALPVYWQQGSPKPGEAYLLAEEKGKGEEMKKAIFRAQMVEKRNIGDIEVLESIAKKLGLGPDFSRRLKAGDKAKDAQKALDMARSYRVNDTPTLIIAGNIKTDPHKLQHDIDAFRQNVILILRSLLKQ